MFRTPDFSRMFPALFFFTVVQFSSDLSAAEVSSARHQVYGADNGRIVKYAADGEPVWKHDLGSKVHKIQVLENGNILTQFKWKELVEISPQYETVWRYDAFSDQKNVGRKLEIHTFHRFKNGETALIENGVGRMLRVASDGTIVHEAPYQVQNFDAHRDVRQAHWLKNGNILVCHEAEGAVVEYLPDGAIAWRYDIPLFGRSPAKGHGAESWGNQVFNALRLPDGNTLIATGNGHSVLEVTPQKEIVWHLKQDDLPGIRLAWTTSLEQLANGNRIIGNCHAGPNNPQLIEVSRDKKVVWTFKDFDLLGDSTAASGTYGDSSTLRP